MSITNLTNTYIVTLTGTIKRQYKRTYKNEIYERIVKFNCINNDNDQNIAKAVIVNVFKEYLTINYIPFQLTKTNKRYDVF